MFKGEPVTVLVPTITYDQATKDEIVSYAEQPVDNVLFASPSTEQIEEAMNLFGVHAQYVLHFPQEYTDSLRGCKVMRPRDGRTYTVAGDPQPYPPENCPTDWNRGVTVGWVDG